jgi:hypothetical protein
MTVNENRGLFGSSGGQTLGVIKEDPVQSDMSLVSSIVSHMKPLDASRIFRSRSKLTESVVTVKEESFTNVTNENTLRLSLTQNVNTDSEAITTRKVTVTYINFIDTNFIDHVIWDRATFSEKWRAFWYMLTWRIEDVIAFVGEKLLTRGGLLGSYTDFIQYSGRSLFEALTAVTKGLEYGTGVGVNCQYCKDRSGITVALVRSIIKDPREDIIEDYHKSEAGLLPWRESMVKSFVAQGLDSSWVMAPKDVIKELFDFIDTKYGSLNHYLDSIGFSNDWRERLLACSEDS